MRIDRHGEHIPKGDADKNALRFKNPTLLNVCHFFSTCNSKRKEILSIPLVHHKFCRNVRTVFSNDKNLEIVIA